jgi:DNA-binding response OmpR family regulator
VKGAIVELTLKEYELLRHLVTHPGRVFTRANLLDSIWGYDYYGGMRTVDVHVRRLRSKLLEMGNTIATVRGVGYRFDPP